MTRPPRAGLRCLATLLVAVALAWCGPASARPGGSGRLTESLRGPGVTVWFASGSERLAHWAGQLVTHQRDQIAGRLALDAPDEIEVLVAETRVAFDEAVAARVGHAPPQWSLAVAIGNRSIAIHTGRLDPTGDGNLEVVVAHEVAHIVLAHAGGDLPRWMHEGLAMWASGETIGDLEVNSIAKQARAGKLERLSSLGADFPEHQRDAQLAYLQSLATVDLLHERHGDEGLRRLLRAVRAGAPFATALRITLNEELVALEDEVEARLANRYQLLYDLLNPEAMLSLAAILALLAFVRYRLRRRRILDRMGGSERSEAGTEPSP